MKIIRSLYEPCGKTDLVAFDVSFYLNSVACSAINFIGLWNYETFVIDGHLKLPDMEVSQLLYLDPFPVIAVANQPITKYKMDEKGEKTD